MKRLPLALTLLALIALAASIAFWVLQLYKPTQRPLAATPLAAAPEPAIDAAATLFGGQAAAAAATNFHLTGVVAAGSNSVAILYAEGSPPAALTVGKEVTPGVTVSEVHARYVMLSDGGVMKRIDLPVDVKSNATPAPGPAGSAPAGEPQTAPGALRPPAEPPEAGRGDVGAHDEPPPAPVPAQPPPPQPTAVQVQPGPAPQAQPSPAPPPQPTPAQPAVTPQQLRQAAQRVQAPQPVQAAPVQMPAPTRSPGSPVNQPAQTR